MQLGGWGVTHPTEINIITAVASLGTSWNVRVANPSSLPAAPCHTLVPLTAWCWRHWQQGPWPLEGQGSGHVDLDWPGLPSGFPQLQHTCHPTACHASCPYPQYLQGTNDDQLAMTLSDPCTKILKQCLIVPAVLIPNTCIHRWAACNDPIWPPHKDSKTVPHHASCPDPHYLQDTDDWAACIDYTTPIRKI